MSGRCQAIFEINKFIGVHLGDPTDDGDQLLIERPPLPDNILLDLIQTIPKSIEYGCRRWRMGGVIAAEMRKYLLLELVRLLDTRVYLLEKIAIKLHRLLLTNGYIKTISSFKNIKTIYKYIYSMI
jgi:hypothetical protein